MIIASSPAKAGELDQNTKGLLSVFFVVDQLNALVEPRDVLVGDGV